jgi:signal peptidase I
MQQAATARKAYERWRRTPQRAFRVRGLEGTVLLIIAAVLVHAFALEPFQVPTGSMAPALVGHHRNCLCPNCGMAVAIGRPRADLDGQGGSRFYAKAFCPNCGEALQASDVPETAGDQVLVNKIAFALRRPRRWEVVVLRLFGRVFIKRVIGLPGETLVIEDGDIYVDDRLVRKSFEQAMAMRVLVFEQSCRPADGWADRWELSPDSGTDDGLDLRLDGRVGPQTLTYRNGPPVAGKYPPVRDEYAYNGGLVGGNEMVHDFSIDADVDVLGGAGTLKLRLCDGRDWVEAALPVARAGEVEARSLGCSPFALREGRADHAALSARGARGLQNGRHRVEMAFVDRRLNVRIDGRRVLEDVDLPAPGPRVGVSRPVQIEVDGVAIALRGFRLYRDVHYTQRGRCAVIGEPVHLGDEQYFVLGDNSPNSEDSRFWPQGAVSEAQLVGSAFLVHLPSVPVEWRYAGSSWLGQLPDVGRIRLIR